MVVSGLIFSVSFRLPVAMLWSERFTIAESFYSVNYRLSIITSKVRQIIPVMKTKNQCFQRNDNSKIVHYWDYLSNNWQSIIDIVERLSWWNFCCGLKGSLCNFASMEEKNAEFVGTFLCSLLGSFLYDFEILPRFPLLGYHGRILAQSFGTLCLVLSAFNFTGGFYHPIMASIRTYGCRVL